jgi:hypothetical protein
MNGKFLAVILVTAVIIGLAWKVTDDRAPQTEVQRGALNPGLLEQVNSAHRVELRSAKSTTVLLRNGDDWHIENKDQFLAQPSQVRRALLQLADLRIVEAKTTSLARYPRLGVNDVTDENAEGTLVKVDTADQQTLLELIAGHRRTGGAGDQRYVRHAGEAQSWLVEGALDVPSDPIRWLETSIADVDTERVREVSITGPERVPIVLTKLERDDDFFSLQNIPEGYEAKSKSTVSSIGALLLDLRFNNVATASRVADTAPQRHIELTTFDGLRVRIDEFSLDEESYARFSFSFDEMPVAGLDGDIAATEDSLAQSDESESAAGTGSQDATDAIDSDVDDTESVADEAARLAARTANWIYVLPDYKKRMFQRDFDSLIKEQQESE